MTQALTMFTPVSPEPAQSLADLAVLSLASPHSRRAYSRQIQRFIDSHRPLTREGVQLHVQSMRDSGAGAVTINHAISAIRLLAREAYVRGQLNDSDLYAIETVKGVARRGVKLGNWLELPALKTLIDAAGHGINAARNQALLAVLAGCGLRRAEVVSLTWVQFVMRSDRWVLKDIRGKGDKARTVAVSPWVARYLMEWRLLADADAPLIFAGLGVQGLYYVVQIAARDAGIPELAPHDLRRSYSRLARDGGASLEHIQAALGHASIETTTRYLNTILELRPGMACGDFIRL